MPGSLDEAHPALSLCAGASRTGPPGAPLGSGGCISPSQLRPGNWLRCYWGQTMALQLPGDRQVGRKPAGASLSAAVTRASGERSAQCAPGGPGWDPVLQSPHIPSNRNAFPASKRPLRLPEPFLSLSILSTPLIREERVGITQVHKNVSLRFRVSSQGCFLTLGSAFSQMPGRC